MICRDDVTYIFCGTKPKQTGWESNKTMASCKERYLPLQLEKLASASRIVTVLEFKIPRVYRIPGMEELDVFAAIIRRHLTVPALISLKVVESLCNAILLINCVQLLVA